MEQQLRIGEWRVDPETNQLRRGHESVRIEPKAMDVLMLLAAHVGRVVMREQIFAAVWPGVVVGDEALTQSIIKLRRALGDDSRAPAYIETIAKRGYRLIAPVVRDGGVSPRPWFRPTPQQSRTAIALTGVVLMIVGIIGAYVLPWTPDADTPTDASAPRAETRSTIAIGMAPFEALAGSDDAYLARGITDDLAADLSRVAGLRLVRAPGASAAATPSSA